eukprot:SAG22_NODE_77_length_22125_cov_46.140016_22_plen_151_part_00
MDEHLSGKPEDEHQQAIRREFDEWRPLHAASDQEAAAEIAAAGVHILIDMQGHTLHRRPGIVLRKPAPLILSMQGFAATTGIGADTLGAPVSPSSSIPSVVRDKLVWSNWFGQPTPTNPTLPVSCPLTGVRLTCQHYCPGSNKYCLLFIV